MLNLLHPLTRAYCDAYLWVCKRPCEKEAVEMVKDLTVPVLRDTVYAKSLTHAQMLLKLGIEAAIQFDVDQEMNYIRKQMITVSSFDAIAYLEEKRRLETDIQTMLFKTQHPRIAQAQALLYALLDHPDGPAAGYEVYQANSGFNSNPALNLG